jgi:hypothetical protein
VFQSTEPIELTDGTIGDADFIASEGFTLARKEVNLELKKTTVEKFRGALIMAEASHLTGTKK